MVFTHGLETRDVQTDTDLTLVISRSGLSLGHLAVSLCFSPALLLLTFSLSLFLLLVAWFLDAVVVLVPNDPFLGVPLAIFPPLHVGSGWLGVFKPLWKMENSCFSGVIMELWGQIGG